MQERTWTQDGKIFIQKTQDISAHLEHAKHLAETHRNGGDLRLAGTVDMVTAERWASECGHPIGSHEFAEYIKRKLMDGEFARFRVKGF